MLSCRPLLFVIEQQRERENPYQKMSGGGCDCNGKRPCHKGFSTAQANSLELGSQSCPGTEGSVHSPLDFTVLFGSFKYSSKESSLRCHASRSTYARRKK